MSYSACPSCGGKNVQLIIDVTPPDWEEFLRDLAEKKTTETLKDLRWQCTDCSSDWGEKK